MAPINDLTELLRNLEPVLAPGTYVFASVPGGSDVAGLEPLATFREAEGLSLILEEGRALAAGLRSLFRAAWIILEVPSDLHAVGLTAPVAAALTRAGISCNVVAAACHDHLFVPFEDAAEAMAVLRGLQAEATRNPCSRSETPPCGSATPGLASVACAPSTRS
jgi:hypothetical protein